MAECCLISWPTQLVWSQEIHAGVGGLHTGMIGGRNFGGEGLHHPLCQRGKEDHSRLPAIELRIRLGVLELRSSKRGVGLLSAYLWPWGSSPMVYRGCLLELGFVTKQQEREKRLGG